MSYLFHLFHLLQLSSTRSYEIPSEAYAAIKGHLAFYASKADACYVDDELAVAQPGDFYGGWITPDITGPFKGGPNSFGW